MNVKEVLKKLIVVCGAVAFFSGIFLFMFLDSSRWNETTCVVSTIDNGIWAREYTEPGKPLSRLQLIRTITNSTQAINGIYKCWVKTRGRHQPYISFEKGDNGPSPEPAGYTFLGSSLCMLSFTGIVMYMNGECCKRQKDDEKPTNRSSSEDSVVTVVIS